MDYKNTITVNEKHKDTLFRIIFRDKKELLSLYNALAGTDYQNPDALTINTKRDVIYVHMKNDISFILDDHLCLYEHQSTFNPNMPLRGLLYLSDLYKPYTDNRRIYTSKLVKLPNPRYIVFYNGTKNMRLLLPRYGNTKKRGWIQKQPYSLQWMNVSGMIFWQRSLERKR